MKDELLPFYQFKQIIEYKGYRLVVSENTKVKNISKYFISIFRGNDKIGEHEADNQGQVVHKIKSRIDQAEETGGQLDLNL